MKRMAGYKFDWQWMRGEVEESNGVARILLYAYSLLWHDLGVRRPYEVTRGLCWTEDERLVPEHRISSWLPKRSMYWLLGQA